MDEKILALLIAAFSGVRKDGLKMLARTIALQASTEEEAKAIVEKLTKTQVDNFIKDYRSDVDKEVSDGTKTFEENLKKKYDFVEKGGNPNPAPGEGEGGKKGKNEGEDIATIIANAVAGAVKPLQDKLEKLEKVDAAKSRLQMLNEKLNTCEDDAFKAKALKDYNRMSFESDEAFNEYLTDTEKDIAEVNQRKANENLGGQGRPMFAQKNESGISTGVAQFIESQKSASSLGGKEI